MTSDPFKLVTDRRFQELRDEAHRHRLVQDARTGAEPRGRHAFRTLVETVRTVAQRRRQRVSISMDVHETPGVNAMSIAAAEVDVEAHGLVALHAGRR